jgi:hypothetical protein
MGLWTWWQLIEGEVTRIHALSCMHAATTELSTDNCWSRILCAALSQLQLACSIEIFIFFPQYTVLSPVVLLL